MRPFLVDTCFAILKRVQGVTPFELLLRLLPPQTKEGRGGLTEAWVLVNLCFAVTVVLVLSSRSPVWLHLLAVAYGAIRVAEVLLFQFYSQILGGYPTKPQPRIHYTVLGLRRSIVLAMILYGEVLIWFAAFYRWSADGFKTELKLDSAIVALYYSATTITTLGYGDISPQRPFGFALVITEVLAGVFMAVLILARVVAYLPAPRSKDQFEQSPIDPEMIKSTAGKP